MIFIQLNTILKSLLATIITCGNQGFEWVSSFMYNVMGNWQNWHGFWQMPWSMNSGWFAGGGFVVLILLLAWSLAWKGLALWKAARHGSAGWFVVLLIVNALGILDILYIYVFSKKHKKVE